MRYCGITECMHDASITFIDDQGNIEFAGEAERYSKVKNDANLHVALKSMIEPNDYITWFEDPMLRRMKLGLMKYTPVWVKSKYNVRTFGNHHQSHCASAYYTRPWESSKDTVLLSIDGYGEYQSATIHNHKFELLYEETYPRSIGSMYSIVTDMLGYKANQEEYIVMGMASFGEPKYVDDIRKAQDKICRYLNLEEDHIDKIGVNLSQVRPNLRMLLSQIFKNASNPDIAASLQLWAEQEILKLASRARKYGSKLCYAGGVAQNVKANSLVRELFDDMWIAINPTDGGCSLGAAARQYALATGRDRVNWIDGYLGHDDGGDINPSDVTSYLLQKSMCGVVSGPAEFGPRALGNRSLLADPRLDIKDTVNTIKRRQKFRPFAPVILEEFVNEYFEGPTSRYMQYTAQAKHDYKSVTHVDGSARVQTVPENSRSIIRPILEEWYEKTGIPMLLNTSLNVRGKPICNDRYDAYQFEVTTGAKVFYNDSY